MKLKKKLFDIAGCGLMLVISLTASSQQHTRSKLLPDHVKFQYAGSIGFVSAGAGYDSKKNKTAADLFYSYLPASVGGVTTHALTGKFTWSPVKTARIQMVKIKPWYIGLTVNYAFGKQYYSFSPEQYPFNFYNFPTSFHLGLFQGGEVFVDTRHSKRIKQLGVYYELITIDRELLSFINNSNYLGIDDVFHLGLGIRAGF